MAFWSIYIGNLAIFRKFRHFANDGKFPEFPIVSLLNTPKTNFFVFAALRWRGGVKMSKFPIVTLIKLHKTHSCRGADERGGGVKNCCQKFGTLHEFACHPCAGAMLIFSVSFQF